MPKYAPARVPDGLYAYVRSSTSPWRIANGQGSSEALVYAKDLASAKSEFGWTRELHTYVKVRRATVEEVQTLHDYA
jgi:hypothetical protein